MKNKVVQGLWIGDELSLLEQLSIKSFLANGHEYHLYVYDDIKNIPEGTIVKEANEIIDSSEIYKNTYFSVAFGYLGFSDYFRVKLIYDKGGFWADTDIVCLKHFDFEEDYVFTPEVLYLSVLKIAFF
jgi:mannosyltransferase OCH1-like enzyme